MDIVDFEKETLEKKENANTPEQTPENKSPPNEKSPKRRRSTKKIKRQLSRKQSFTVDDTLSLIEIYEKEDLNHEYYQKLQPMAGFKGPVKERTQTDQVWTVLYIITMGFVMVYSIYIMTQGKPVMISNGYDLRGEICGIDGLTYLPYKYYLQPNVDVNVVMCVAKCPTTTGQNICIYDIDYFTPTPFCYVQMTSSQIGRFCIPKEILSRQPVDTIQNTSLYQVKRIFSDLYLSYDLILISLVFCSLFAYLNTYLLQFEKFIAYQIWGAIGVATLCFGYMIIMFYMEYLRVISTRCLFGVDKHQCGGLRAYMFMYLCYGFAGVGLLYIIFVIKNFNKINLGIGLIKKASLVVVVLEQLRFFAIFVSVLGLAISSYCFVVIIFGLTGGQFTSISATNVDGKSVYSFTMNQIMQISAAIPGFFILFNLMLILSIVDMFNSYALSVWFFTKKKSTVEIPIFIVVKELLWHHLGTSVYLTFNYIFFSLPKIIFAQIRSILYSLPQNSKVVRFTQGLCITCLWMENCFLRFISNHTFVQVGIWSQKYSISSQKAYFLLKRNRSMIRDLDFLVEFILVQIKLAVSLICSAPVYLVLVFCSKTLTGTNTSDIESPIGPTLLCFIGGFFFSSCFLATYDIASKSVIQLYLVDREMFYGEQRFSEKFINDFMEFYGKPEQEERKGKSGKQMRFQAEIEVNEEPSEENEEEQSDEEHQPDIHEDEESEYEEDAPNNGANNWGEEGAFDEKFNEHHKRAHEVEGDPFNLDDLALEDPFANIKEKKQDQGGLGFAHVEDMQVDFNTLGNKQY